MKHFHILQQNMVEATRGSFQLENFEIFNSNNPVRYPWNTEANQVSSHCFQAQMLFLAYKELPVSVCFQELFVHILVALFPVLVLF